MLIATIDFETYFADDFTLSKMTQEAYIRDKRFESHGAAIKWGANTKARWYTHQELVAGFPRVDWSQTAVLHHHAQFDAAILNWHYGVRPKFIFDTLSMARQILGNHISVSLDSVRKHYGIHAKTTPYNLFKGRHWHEMTPDVQRLVGEGAEDEVESIWKIFQIMGATFPVEEYEVIDTTIRMFSEPVLRADSAMLAKVWEAEDARKKNLMEELGVNEDDLQSAGRFAELLLAEGIEPEMKDGKNGQIYAFAKTDPFMTSLLEDEDDRVRGLAECRLGVKSTFRQARVETLGWMASRGPLPVYLNMYGAHTTRWSGGDKVNWQNNDAAIEKAILPPDGYFAFEVDASQIECRILNAVAGQEDKVEEFRQKLDPYVGVASAFAGFPVNEVDHPELRQAGKVVELLCGFGGGGMAIRRSLRVKAGIRITPEEGEKYKFAYRSTHPFVEDLWKQGGRVIARLAGGAPMDWGPVHIADGKMYLPNGTAINYTTLEYYRDDEYDDSYWRMKTRRGWSKLYGAKLVENLIQALARVFISQVMIRLVRAGYKIINTKHDSMWILIPMDGREKDHVAYIKNEMRQPPAWLPDVPLDAESRLAARFGK